MKMRIVKILFGCHLIALLFGLAGLLIALPHPQLWQQNAHAGEVFSFGMHDAGSLHILLGAATMLAFGLLFVGVRKTLIFFFTSTILSLSMELLGTSTGVPFGPYAYTDLLGYKILGHVPFPIPLSWFYMGFTAYLLANLLIARAGWRRQTLWSLLLGGYFLTVWDLSLDPSMSNSHLAVQFWNWYTPGPYFGMPISNLVGWSLTGLFYMSVSRLLWRAQLDVRRIVAWLPFGMYVANTGFAMLLSLGSGLWQPSVIAVVLGLFPATAVFWLPRFPGNASGSSGKGSADVSHQLVRTGSALLLRRRVICQVEGLEHLPTRGPTMIAARHVHHLYDGCALLTLVPRRLHLLVGLDWIQRPLIRDLMERCCKLVEWPIVLRAARLNSSTLARTSAYRASEARGYLRRAVALSLNLLRQGEVLVIFPEGYPLIDPHPGPREEHQTFLPFQPGFARLLELAERDGKTRVALIPAGLTYTRQERTWQLFLRFGPALFRQDFPTQAQFMTAVEQQVQTLSTPEAPAPSCHTYTSIS
jgi:uncharacterized membrane protein/1-acyl-sn-glycerol-3-phosphate acyltransferase